MLLHNLGKYEKDKYLCSLRFPLIILHLFFVALKLICEARFLLFSMSVCQLLGSIQVITQNILNNVLTYWIHLM